MAVADGEARLLRPGATTPEALAEALAELDPPIPLLLGAVGKTASPGLMAKHYSPRASPVPADRRPGRDPAGLTSSGRAGAVAAGRRVGVLLVDEDVSLRGRSAGARSGSVALGSEADLAQVAGRLFAAMRDLDAAGCDAIYARALGTSGLGLAILDRLTRAAHRPDSPSDSADNAPMSR